MVQGTFGDESVDAKRRHVRARSPTYVVHGEVLDVPEGQALERDVQRVRADVLEAVLAREAGLHMDEAPRGEQVCVAAGKDLQFLAPLDHRWRKRDVDGQTRLRTRGAQHPDRLVEVEL